MSNNKKLGKVVVNSSPIIGLAILDLVFLLWELFDEVFITRAVYNELIEKKSRNQLGKTELRKAIKQEKIKIYQVKDKGIVHDNLGKLHQGELETIAAAKELKANYILLDDKAARKLAETFMMEPTGLIGVLRLAKRKGIIKKLRPLLDQLIENSYRIAPELYTEVLTEEGE